MDLIDQAQSHEAWARQIALARAAGSSPRGESATHCVMHDCGDEIPLARRLALPGVRWCITCAQRMERTRGAA